MIEIATIDHVHRSIYSIYYSGFFECLIVLHIDVLPARSPIESNGTNGLAKLSLSTASLILCVRDQESIFVTTLYVTECNLSSI